MESTFHKIQHLIIL